MTDERIIISAPAQMAALKTIYDHCRPGHHPDWDFSQLKFGEQARVRNWNSLNNGRHHG